jgi:hypothetical protein
MSFEAIEWFDMQKQSQVALFSPFGTQKPIESEHSERHGIDFKLWFAEELRATMNFQLNAFAKRCTKF